MTRNNNSGGDLAQISQVPAARQAEFLGQATAIEQARAVAEVYAAITVAQQRPRNIPAAIASMRMSCQQKGLADRAFFSFRRGGDTIAGPSIHLARELARCWGNIQYGIAELRRDDEAGISEMQAYAWDVETNTREAQIFIVPHARDRSERNGGRMQLTDMRDIYENNANQGARRVREAIFAVLPVWYTDEAKNLCSQTVKDGGGVPLPQRVANAIATYEAIGVTTTQLEARTHRKSSEWTDTDVAQLRILFQSIDRGEIMADEEFPREKTEEKPAEI